MRSIPDLTLETFLPLERMSELAQSGSASYQQAKPFPHIVIDNNKDWRDEYDGFLQLWNRDVSACEAKVAPLFNRVMIFSTTDFTYHGHPDPLRCPEGMTRKSLALYYFSNGRPQEELSGEHSALFRARNEADFRLTFGQRMRTLGKDLVPPVLARRLWRSI